MLPQQDLLIIFWILFGLLISFGTFYIIFQVVPLYRNWKSFHQQKIEFKKNLQEKRKLFQKSESTASNEPQTPSQPKPTQSPKTGEYSDTDPLPPTVVEQLVDSISLFGGFLILEWLLFPTMLVSFEILRCEKTDNEWNLIGNSHFECWTSTHIGYIIAACISLALSVLFGMFWNLERSKIVPEYFHHPRFCVFIGELVSAPFSCFSSS